MKVFRTVFDRIETVELVRETKKQIIYRDNIGVEHRELKESSYTSIHKTFMEAKNYLIDKYSKNVDKAKNNLKYAQEKLDTIRLLEEPK